MSNTPNIALLRALDLAAAGDWDGAHKLVQDENSQGAAWIHAHLHRVEGDLSNARYWYGRAGKPMATSDFDTERRAIAQTLANDRA
ncbi:MAG: hypothetical protein WDM79_05655 [Terricaulis sp.]